MRATFLRRLIAVIVSVVVIAATVRAQGPQAAAQVIRGRVVSADTGQPLPNARVAVAGTPTAVRAGLDGRFALSAPPDALLVVTKAGFVRLEETLASRRDSTQPLDLRLIRATVVAGRVTDEYGDPVVGAMVLVASRSKQPLSMANLASTDDRGEYRVGGLPPGTYTVSVRTEGAGQATSRPITSIPEMRGFAQADGRQAMLQLKILASPTFTTYYPGAVDEADAAPIALAAGDERSDIDFHVTAAQSTRQFGSVYPSIVALQDLSLPMSGTASIHGTITSRAGQVLPRALVVLADQKGQRFLTTAAGNDGRYAFESLQPGSYRVAASKPGYSLPTAPSGLPTAGTFGRDGIPVVVARNDALDRVNLALQPWGSISGHVFDETGEPVSGVSVSLLLPRYERGRRRLVPTGGAQARTTDDRGEFRLYAIPDGEYVLSASLPTSVSGNTGGYAPTFFPGTSAVATARLITVTTGDDTKGLDFSLALTPNARVSGRWLDAEGRPTSGGRFTLLSRSPLATRLDAIINPDGTFEFRNVPPGSYVIQADRGNRGGSVEGAFAAYPVLVSDTDVTGVTVQTSPGTTVSGRVNFDSISGAVAPRSGIALSAIPLDFDLAPPNLAVAQLDAEGTFTLTGISGVRRLQTTRLAPGWMVKSILSDGIDVTDEPLAFGRPGQTWQTFEVMLTDRINTVTGTVTDDRSQRIAGAPVVIFSADRDRWYPASRFVRSTDTRADGVFSIAGMPTGSYFIAPAPRAPAGEEGWRDPAFLDSLRPSARSVIVGEGDTQMVNLRVSPR